MRERETKRWRLGRGSRPKRRRLTSIALLPTLITLGNLACGLLSLFYAAEGFAVSRRDFVFRSETPESFYAQSAWFILLAMIFDALDGRVARLTRTASNFGAQLDSLCDLVTFGVAPAFLVHSLCTAGQFARLPHHLVTTVCVFYAICAAVRLARFNIETTSDLSSHLQFAGLPSPASAGVVAASLLPWTAASGFPFLETLSSLLLRSMPIVTFLLGILMISRLRYTHVLNRLFRGLRPFVVFVELSLFVLLAALFHEFAIFLAFVGYALSGPFLWARSRLLRREGLDQAPAPEPGEPLF